MDDFGEPIYDGEDSGVVVGCEEYSDKVKCNV